MGPEEAGCGVPGSINLSTGYKFNGVGSGDWNGGSVASAGPSGERCEKRILKAKLAESGSA